MHSILSVFSSVSQVTGMPVKWTAFGQSGSGFHFWYNKVPTEIQTAVIIRWPRATFTVDKDLVKLFIPAELSVTLEEITS